MNDWSTFLMRRTITCLAEPANLGPGNALLAELSLVVRDRLALALCDLVGDRRASPDLFCAAWGDLHAMQRVNELCRFIALAVTERYLGSELAAA